MSGIWMSMSLGSNSASSNRESDGGDGGGVVLSPEPSRPANSWRSSSAVNSHGSGGSSGHSNGSSGPPSAASRPSSEVGRSGPGSDPISGAATGASLPSGGIAPSPASSIVPSPTMPVFVSPSILATASTLSSGDGPLASPSSTSSS